MHPPVATHPSPLQLQSASKDLPINPCAKYLPGQRTLQLHSTYNKSLIMDFRHDDLSGVWNVPVSENYVLKFSSYPMTNQFSNDSYGSTTSSSYSSNAGSYGPGSSTYIDAHGGRCASQSQTSSRSHNPIYDSDYCISPSELHAPPSFRSPRESTSL